MGFEHAGCSTFVTVVICVRGKSQNTGCIMAYRAIFCIPFKLKIDTGLRNTWAKMFYSVRWVDWKSNILIHDFHSNRSCFTLFLLRIDIKNTRGRDRMEIYWIYSRDRRPCVFSTMDTLLLKAWVCCSYPCPAPSCIYNIISPRIYSAFRHYCYGPVHLEHIYYIIR